MAIDAYSKTEWVDRDVENPTQFRDQISDTVLDLVPEPGNINEEGTQIIAAKLNNLENKVEELTNIIRLMTAKGSMLRCGDAAYTPEELAAGTNGYQLVMIDGKPTWALRGAVAAQLGSNIIASAPTARTLYGSTPTRIKSFYAPFDGKYRISYEWKKVNVAGDGSPVYSYLHNDTTGNNLSNSQSRTATYTTYVSLDFNAEVAAGDRIDIMVYAGNALDGVYVEYANFKCLIKNITTIVDLD